MEYNENDCKLLFELRNGDNEKIDTYSISTGKGLLLGIQVSGEIQSYDDVEIGLYTDENAPLCAFGPYVITRIPVSEFLLSMQYVVVGIYHPNHQSTFGHMSFWTENNRAKGVELDLKETLKFWNKYLPGKETLELKLMLSGYSKTGKKNFMRGPKVMTLTK